MKALVLLFLLGGCVTTQTESVVSSYCQLYTPIIQQKGDGTIVATPGVKRHIIANEKTYRKVCGGNK